MEFAEQPLDAIPNISSVPGQVLAQICDHIQDPEDLLAFSSTCSLFRSSAAHSRAWLSFCRRRWGGGASPQVLFPRKVADYKTLFLSSNGWRGKCKLTPAHAFSDCVEYAALHCVAPCELDQDPDAYAVAVSNQGTNRMELFRLRGGKQRLENGETCEQGDADPQYKAEVVQSARLLFSDPHPSPICSIKMDRSGSLIVAGRCDGTLSTYRPSKDSENWMDEGVFLLPMDVPPYPISSLELNEWAGLTYALVDRGECGAWHPNRNGCTMVVDPSVTGPPAAKLHEVVDAYDLCAFQPVGEGGSDVLAASVKISQDRWLDGICPSCDPQLPASMCHHQHRSAAAALVTFDARANVPGGLVARHALPHRSIMPCLQVAREHYVMLSHAGEPLVIWDRRCLRCPLDCPALDLSWNPLHGARMPPTTTNPNPHKRLSNGLYLSVSTSVLAARADNGGIGIWSLSSLLGWEDGTPAPWRKRALKATAHAPVERGVLAPVATFDAPFFPCSTRHLEGRPRDRAEVWVGDSWVAALSQTAGVAGGESHLHHHTGKQQELLFFRM